MKDICVGYYCVTLVFWWVPLESLSRDTEIDISIWDSDVCQQCNFNLISVKNKHLSSEYVFLCFKWTAVFWLHTFLISIYLNSRYKTTALFQNISTHSRYSLENLKIVHFCPSYASGNIRNMKTTLILACLKMLGIL